MGSVIRVAPHQGNLDRSRIQFNAPVKETFLGLREDSVRHLFSLIELNNLPRFGAVMGTVTECVIRGIKRCPGLRRQLKRFMNVWSPSSCWLNPRLTGLSVKIKLTVLTFLP
jgi:hypothetical protein